MKSYIADTLIGIFALDESGNILNFIDFDDNYEKIVEFYNSLDNNVIQKRFEDFLSDLKNAGFDELIFDNLKLEELTSEKLGYKTIKNFTSRITCIETSFRYNQTRQKT